MRHRFGSSIPSPLRVRGNPFLPRLRNLNWFVVSLSNHGPTLEYQGAQRGDALCREREGVPHNMNGRVGGKSCARQKISLGARTKERSDRFEDGVEARLREPAGVRVAWARVVGGE